MKASSRWSDLLAASCVLLAVAIELVLRELYYRIASEIPRIFGVSALWMLLVGTVVLSGRALDHRWRRHSGRLSFVLAFAVWLSVVFAPALASLTDQTLNWLPIVSLVVMAGLAFRSTDASWAIGRRMIGVAAVLFVLSQPVIASWGAATMYWPQSRPTTPQQGSITVFLLLDELNAKSAGPIADALRRGGADVRQRALHPVGDATAKVIPTMFARKPFQNAKPCGVTSICSGGDVLDFSRIIASRSDIDVVGFYGPYCGIQGLRSCAHLSPASPILDARRWWCAALRRSAWLSDATPDAADAECADLGGRVWSEMASSVEEAIWRAPVWRQGGFLFAHVPLPHPPGEGHGPIGLQYKANLARAVDVVDGIMARIATRPQMRYRIVVFSDHPLRQSVWCQSSTQYRHNGCPFAPELIDDKVPLIVAGNLPEGFDSLTDNGKIFRLATDME